MKATMTEHDDALIRLRAMLSPGDTLYTLVSHVSRSGMQRSIRVFHVADNDPTDITYLVARACSYSTDQNHGGVKVGGCGMDMCFAVVYRLSAELWPKGFGCIGERVKCARDDSGTIISIADGGYDTMIRCPSNDHANGDRDYTPHALSTKELIHGRNHNHWHRDGGYALVKRDL